MKLCLVEKYIFAAYILPCTNVVAPLPHFILFCGKRNAIQDKLWETFTKLMVEELGIVNLNLCYKLLEIV